MAGRAHRQVPATRRDPARADAGRRRRGRRSSHGAGRSARAWQPLAAVGASGPGVAWGEALAPPAGVSAGQSVDDRGRSVYQESFKDLNGWHDFSAELWPLERTAADWRFAGGPMLTVPFETAGLSIRARYEDPRPGDPVWFVRVQRATSADGVRMILPDAFNAERTDAWNGSVLEWWLDR